MSDKPPTDGAGSINRRTVLKASGVSLAAGGGFVTTAAGREDPPKGPGDRRPERQPDLQIVDNSASEAPVRAAYRHLANGSPGRSGEQPDTARVAVRDHETVGIHANQGVATTGELDIGPNDLANANATVDRISFEEPPTALKRGERRPFEVEVSHQGSSDSTEIFLGPNGAADEETISVHVDVDGSVSVDVTVTCP